MADVERSSGLAAWAARHDERTVKNAPRQARVTAWLGCAAWAAIAAILISVAVGDGASPAELRGFALPVLLTAGIAVYFLWRATRFHIVKEAGEAGGSLELTAPRRSVTLQAADVIKVEQLRQSPYRSIFSPPNPAWGAWFRVDASGGMLGRRYLVWRPDTPAFLEQLRRAGFPVVGEVARVPGPAEDASVRGR